MEEPYHDNKGTYGRSWKGNMIPKDDLFPNDSVRGNSTLFYNLFNYRIKKQKT